MKTPFDNYIGNEELVQIALETVDALSSPSFVKMQVDKPSMSTILYGPPGTGKTYFVELLYQHILATATTLNWRRFDLSLENINAIHVGETEKYLIEFYADIHKWLLANPNNRAFIFADEFDTICPPRGGEGASGNKDDKVVGLLLKFMNGRLSPELVKKAEKMKNTEKPESPESPEDKKEAKTPIEDNSSDKNTQYPFLKDISFFLACTNRLDKIDSAARREGRIDTAWLLDFIKKEDSIKKLFHVFFKKYKIQDEVTDEFLNMICEVINMTQVATPAMIEVIVKYAFSTSNYEFKRKVNPAIWQKLDQSSSEKYQTMINDAMITHFDESHLVQQLKQRIVVIMERALTTRVDQLSILKQIELLAPSTDEKKAKIMDLLK